MTTASKASEGFEQAIRDAQNLLERKLNEEISKSLVAATERAFHA